MPVAFHVVYWDKLGWRDTFASRAFTQRQYAYGETWGTRSVYTPCFVRDGVEWRPDGGAGPAARAAENAGVLTVSYAASGAAVISYQPGPAPHVAGRDYDATVALLAGGIVSAVQAGENSGRNLRHEFVATRVTTVKLQAAGEGAPGVFTGTLVLPPSATVAGSSRALAAWVTSRGELTALQATGGWLHDADGR